jgi:hypothetical protein
MYRVEWIQLHRLLLELRLEGVTIVVVLMLWEEVLVVGIRVWEVALLGLSL